MIADLIWNKIPFLRNRAKQMIMSGITPSRIKSLKETHKNWLDQKKLHDTGNSPLHYSTASGRYGGYILEQVLYLGLDKDAHILEIGCNSGRNLNHLWKNGYHRLSGIEINPDAVALMKDVFPEMYSSSMIYNYSVEDIITHIDEPFDLIFTNAVLMHIHPDSNWIFPHIARLAKSIVTHEAENSFYPWVFPRDYSKIFLDLGFKMVKHETKDWGDHPTYDMRIFQIAKNLT